MRAIELLALGFALVLPRLSAIGRWPALADAFLLAAVTGWITLATLPEAIAIGGWWAVAGLAAGWVACRRFVPLDGSGRTMLAFAALVGTACGLLVEHHSTDALPPWPRWVTATLTALMAAGTPALVALLVRQGRPLPRPPARRRLPLVANLAGFGAGLAAASASPSPALVPEALPALATLRTLAIEGGPGLLLALLLSGVLRALPKPLPGAWLCKGSTVSQALRGVAVGAPLPICSCGVVPLYRSLIVGGAPPAAALAFLVATPEIGVDAVLLSVPLLGPWLTAARVAAAAIVATIVGVVVGGRLPRLPAAPRQPSASGLPAASWHTRLRTLGVEGFREATDHTLPLIAAGLVLAAMLEPLVDPRLLAQLPSGFDVPVAGLLGIPIYVCASAATPLVAVLMHKGLSTGAAIAFLLTGPATNVTTLGLLGRLHGPKAAAWFGITVGLCASLLGWAVNMLGIDGGIALHTVAEHGPGPTGWLCAIALASTVLASLYRQGIRGIWERLLLREPEGLPHHHHSHHHPHHEGCCGRHNHAAGDCSCVDEQREPGANGKSPAAQSKFERIEPRRLMRPRSSDKGTSRPE